MRNESIVGSQKCKRCSECGKQANNQGIHDSMRLSYDQAKQQKKTTF